MCLLLYYKFGKKTNNKDEIILYGEFNIHNLCKKSNHKGCQAGRKKSIKIKHKIR